MTRTLFLLLITGLMGLALTNSLLAETEEERLKRLYNDFRCPTCQGLSVNDSEASFSVQIRNKIEELVQMGATDTEIEAYFVERYGEWILRSTPKEGFNLVLWVLPGGLILGALFMLYRLSHQWTLKNKEKQKKQDAPLTEEEQRILNRDIEKFQNS